MPNSRNIADMPRKARIVIPGWPHHVTQRGNNRKTVFFTDADRELYLQFVERYFREYHDELLGYCLLDTHVHLIVIPEIESALEKGVGRVHGDYSRYQNLKLDQVGHLWQGRFYSSPVEEDAIGDVLAYVELNPVRAGLVDKAQEWKWSSAQAHFSGVDRTGLLNMKRWEDLFSPRSWAEIVQQKQNDRELLNRIRAATHAGRPIAKLDSIRQLEKILGRPLLPQKRGPKRKR
jgi:putative transposase